MTAIGIEIETGTVMVAGTATEIETVTATGIAGSKSSGLANWLGSENWSGAENGKEIAVCIPTGFRTAGMVTTADMATTAVDIITAKCSEAIATDWTGGKKMLMIAGLRPRTIPAIIEAATLRTVKDFAEGTKSVIASMAVEDGNSVTPADAD